MKKKVSKKVSRMVMIDASHPHVLYDLSIEDGFVRKEKRLRFDNAIQVKDFLGVKLLSTIFNNREVKNGVKPKPVKDLNNKKWAIRFDPSTVK